MRVRLGNDIYFCDKAAVYSDTSIVLKTSTCIFKVECSSNNEAQRCFNALLIQGWYDFTEHIYTKIEK